MARVADHKLKREEVAEAVQRVIAGHGIDAATVREIAREAGCSAGALAHYFRGKDDLLLYAFRLTSERAMERAGRWAGRGPGLATLRAAILETLPLDDERRVEVQTWCSFLGKAIGRPAMAGEKPTAMMGTKGIECKNAPAMTSSMGPKMKPGMTAEQVDAAWRAWIEQQMLIQSATGTAGGNG